MSGDFLVLVPAELLPVPIPIPIPKSWQATHSVCDFRLQLLSCLQFEQRDESTDELSLLTPGMFLLVVHSTL